MKRFSHNYKCIRFISVCLTACMLSGAVTTLVARGQSNTSVKSRSLDLTATDPVSGGWNTRRDVSVGGQVFEKAGIMNVCQDFHPEIEQKMVFSNLGNYARFTCWVGFLDLPSSNKGTIKFQVLGNGRSLYISDDISEGDPPTKVDVDISGCTGVTLIATGENLESYYTAVWASPEFSKTRPPVVPVYRAQVPAQSPPATVDTGSKLLAIPPDKMDELANKLKTASLKSGGVTTTSCTLAIASFKLIPSNDLSPANADNVREDLSTSLFNTGSFSIVERSQLNNALSELKMDLSDTFDSAVAQKLGKLVGAQAVVIGSISDRGPFTVINARMINTQTGKVEAAANIEVNN